MCLDILKQAYIICKIFQKVYSCFYFEKQSNQKNTEMIPTALDNKEREDDSARKIV